MSSYCFITAATASASAPASGSSSKKLPSILANSCRTARGEVLSNHAASVITGQQERSGPGIWRSVFTQISWCSSSWERIATSGPVSTKICLTCLFRTLQNDGDWCSSPLEPGERSQSVRPPRLGRTLTADLEPCQGSSPARHGPALTGFVLWRGNDPEGGLQGFQERGL